MKRHLLALSLGIFASFPAIGSADQPGLEVEQAWSRASMGNDRPGVAYMVVRNTGSETRTLIGAKTDIAMMPQIHRTTTGASGVSQMAPAGDIEIQPGAEIALAPGGLHIMLMKLTQPLIEGESYGLTLLFKNGHDFEVSVPILSPTARNANP